MFAGKKSAQIREILISESAWEEMTCLFAPSLGVIYINHNFATESEARQALNEETDAQGATYYHVILMREPGSNGNMHASADIYR